MWKSHVEKMHICKLLALNYRITNIFKHGIYKIIFYSYGINRQLC